MTVDLHTLQEGAASISGLQTLPAVLRAGAPGDNLSHLQNFSILQGLPPEAHKRLAERLILQYSRGDVLFQQGEPSELVFLILRGLVGIRQATYLTLETRPADESTLAILVPGDLCGEQGVLCSCPRTATATALADTEALVFAADDFLELMGEFATLGLEVSRQLSRNLMVANHRIHGEDARLCILTGAHLLSLGQALAKELFSQTARPVGLTTWSEPETVPPLLGIPPSRRSIQPHPDGFHFVVHRRPEGASDSVHLSLMADALRQRFAWSLLLLEPEGLAAVDKALLSDADALILVGELPGVEIPLSHLSFPPIRVGGSDKSDILLPQSPEEVVAWGNTARTLAARLGRRTEVAAYVPLLDARGQSAEALIHASLNLFARLFGGATLEERKGVWRGDRNALIDDQVAVIRSFTTDADFQKHIDQVLTHLEQLKGLLEQDAMGLFAAGRWILI